MNQAQEPGKRIVSKGEYVVLMGQKASLWSVGAVFTITAFVMMIALYVIIFDRYFAVAHSIKWALLLLIISFSFVVRETGGKCMSAAKQIQPIVPFTHANTADLAASDSLVRASEEPMQTPEGVLLRAAMYGVETPPEQLVRPAQ